MKPGVPGAPGVPTTPVPVKPAPSPRYNDLTRPLSLKLDTGDEGAAASRRFWYRSTGGDEDLSELGAANLTLRRGLGTGQSDQLFRADFPPPWQGCIDLPKSDEEIVNAAQTWVAQILHEKREDANSDANFSSDALVDGRVLCRVAKCIASTSIEVIQHDESSASNDSNIRSFLIACRKFGVPEGALFDVDDRDPKRVGLCLHVLSRVVRETVPDFSGPFLTVSNRSSPRGDEEDTSSDEDNDIITGDHGQDMELRRQRYLDYMPGPSASNLGASDDGGANRSGLCDPGYLVEQQQILPGAAGQREVASFSPRCPPPLHGAPNPPESALQWSRGPPTASGGFAVRTASIMDNPPTSLQRPSSLPSRLSRTIPAGKDAMWDALFLTGATFGGGERGVDNGGLGAWPPAPMLHATTTSYDQRGRLAEVQRHQLPLAVSLNPAATATETTSLSSWLSNLNLAGFEEALAGIGVEMLGDLRYVEEQDLGAIGMHRPQMRKFLQNRP